MVVIGWVSFDSIFISKKPALPRRQIRLRHGLVFLVTPYLSFQKEVPSMKTSHDWNK